MNRAALLALCVTLGAGCGATSEPDPDAGAAGDGVTADGWRLVWSDEFDGAAGEPPDPDHWTSEVGGDGWGNEELQYYTDRTENASLDGEGNLQIVARREDFGGRGYTSARLITFGHFEGRYGRYEARMALPTGAGVWPAFWMLGSNFPSVGWPQCGEIDIMEHVGRQPGIVHGTVHGPGYSAGNAVGGQTAIAGGDVTGFHVYGVEWSPDRIEWFVDGVPYFSVTPDDVPGDWPYDRPFFLLLNLAIGGTFGGPVAADTPFPATVTVDWVRVWERE